MKTLPSYRENHHRWEKWGTARNLGHAARVGESTIPHYCMPSLDYLFNLTHYPFPASLFAAFPSFPSLPFSRSRIELSLNARWRKCWVRAFILGGRNGWLTFSPAPACNAGYDMDVCCSPKSGHFLRATSLRETIKGIFLAKINSIKSFISLTFENVPTYPYSDPIN